MTVLIGTAVLASHPEASLPGSNFEIDVNANLKSDDGAPSTDWAGVTETRRNDAPTGANDNSYSGGSKEDDACPGTTTGSIPNNKSDLLSFGAYVEPELTGPGFLNLFWTRVQEPSGTTLMDFELNQSGTLCANGVNPVRTVGDLLIEYRLEQGGATATIKVREWTGSAWGAATDLTAASLAAGTINSTPIPFAESDGLATSGSVSARTFGEAQLDLDFIFDENECDSFGSAFLKSRASDSFTSQLKDFIAPVPLNITNCGTVIIRKQTDPDENPNTTDFGYTKSFATDPSTPDTFTLKDDGVQTFNNVLFGTGYTVVEDVIPSGWELQSLICSASTGVTPSISSATVTFAIDNAADVLDCTYTNREPPTLTVNKILVPSNDTGLFNLRIDGATAGTGANVGNGGTTGAVQVSVGSHTVSETAGTNTALADYVTVIGGDCAADGTVTLASGDDKTCTITNTRRPTLTVNKVLVPSNDSGLFDLLINGTEHASDVGDGGSTGAQYANVGSNTFGETAGTGTSLSNYISTVSGTGCNSNASGTGGTITLAAGQNAVCTITNTRKATIVVDKVTNPPGDTTSFNFTAGGTGYSNFSLTDAATPNSQSVAPGTYSISESVPDGWTLVAKCTGGSFGASEVTYTNGANFSVTAGQTVNCTFTNTRLFKIIVVTCDQSTDAVVNSAIRLGTDTQTDRLTVTAAQLQAAGVNVGAFCDGLTTFGNLTQGTYDLKVELPNVAGGITPQ